MERWLARCENEGMSARTRNAHQAALVAFCNWAADTGRMIANPLNRMPKANEKSDRRRARRALTEEELVRLLDAARRRPLLEAKTVRRGPRKGRAVAKVRAETRCELEQVGRERALIYKTLVLTGLRKGELASLTAGQLELDGGAGRVAYVVLRPEDEKNGRGSEIPIRADLAADLREWLASRLRQAQDQARRTGEPIPSRLPPDTPLFNVPSGLIRIFDRDLVAAGLARRVKKDGRWVIDKRDDRGRTLDVHALRHSFATHLSKGGVAPRTAQAALRHSTLELTMNTYTDPRLLDVAGALEVLPRLPLDGADAASQQVAKQAAGGETTPITASDIADYLAQNLALTGDRSWLSLSNVVQTALLGESRKARSTRRASDAPGESKPPVATAVTRRHRKRAMGLEPTTFSLEG